jgi:hypothetical protein
MNRELLRWRLIEVEERLIQGEEQISRQRDIVTELERCERDTSDAKAILVQLEEMRGLHVADRDRLLDEFGE